jgi:chromosome segregation ATPase
MPVSVKLSKGFRGSRLGKAAEIRVDSAIAERPDYSDQVIALGIRIHELDRQLEDARKEGTGFLGFGKGKKDQKIADLEAQKAEFILQKQQAEQAQEQVKVFERAIKDVNGFLEKGNNSLFSDDNFKTDKIADAKTLGQFIEVLNTELQRLGQTQLTTEQVAAKKQVDSTEERLQNAQEKLKEMERQVAQSEAYRDMSYKSLLPEYAR